MLRRRSRSTLPLHVVDYLLGVSRTADEIAAMQAAGIDYDAFYEFEPASDAELAQLRQTHRAELGAEAARRGLVFEGADHLPPGA